MQLILIRHGEASSVNGTTIKTDRERTLTDRGHAQAKKTAAFILSKYQPDLLVVSPYIRARQTINVFAENLAINPIIYDKITPMDDEKQALSYLSDIAEAKHAKCVLVVCHMDIVARIHSRLTDHRFSSFMLAETRVLEQSIITEGLSVEIDRYAPE